MYGYRITDLPTYLPTSSRNRSIKVGMKKSLNIGGKDETFHLARPDHIGELFSFFFSFSFSFFHSHFFIFIFSFSESIESVSSSARV